jgi:hypothetical protein
MAPLTAQLTVLPHHFRRGCKTAKSDHKLRHYCTAVRVEKLDFHWTDLREI